MGTGYVFCNTPVPAVRGNSRCEKICNYSPIKKWFNFSLFYHACPGRPGKYAVR